jgi:hypothetical protein
MKRGATETKSSVKEIYTVTIRRDPRTGVAVTESWFVNGRPHREGGPVYIVRDPETGTVIKEHWIRHNEYHRDDGPAIILRKPGTGQIYYSAWYREGVKIPAPKPDRHPRQPSPRRSSPASRVPG